MLLHPFVHGLPVAAPLQHPAKAAPRECASTAQAYQPCERNSIVVSNIADSHDFWHVRDATHEVDVCNALVVIVQSGDSHELPPLRFRIYGRWG